MARNVSSLSSLRAGLYEETKGAPVFLPYEQVKNMMVTDLENLCRRLKATGSSPFLVMRGDYTLVSLPSFSGKMRGLGLGEGLIRVEVFDPRPNSYDLVVDEEAYYNLFDLRR